MTPDEERRPVDEPSGVPEPVQTAPDKGTAPSVSDSTDKNAELATAQSAQPDHERWECPVWVLDSRGRITGERCADHFPKQAATEQSKGLAAAAASADPWWQRSAVRALRACASADQPFTSDDLQDEPYSLPAPHNPNQWGALFALASRKGWITKVGYKPSVRLGAHGRTVAIWRGVPGL